MQFRTVPAKFGPEAKMKQCSIHEFNAGSNAQESVWFQSILNLRLVVLALLPCILLGMTAPLLAGENETSQQAAVVNMELPAQRLTTNSTWDDLALSWRTKSEIDLIFSWLRQRENLPTVGLIKPGYRALFYGPPGTGKTQTAALIGKMVDLPVYRVDLSLVIAKFVGETEANLARVFEAAERQGWILFFDGADALFGKRTETQTSNNRHANPEAAYLLQRIEDFPGVVILAANMKTNIAPAFARRFQSLVPFRSPDAEQRLRIWQRDLASEAMAVGSDVDLVALARKYELTGGAISNVLRRASLKAANRPAPEIRQQDLIEAIKHELSRQN